MLRAECETGEDDEDDMVLTLSLLELLLLEVKVVTVPEEVPTATAEAEAAAAEGEEEVGEEGEVVAARCCVARVVVVWAWVDEEEVECRLWELLVFFLLWLLERLLFWLALYRSIVGGLEDE